MSHIDEATISAYVDRDPSLSNGERDNITAHFSQCQRCSDILADIQSDIDQARSALSLTGPATIHKPAFADLVARATTTTTPQPKYRWALQQGLAAAAILIIAVSVGVYTGKTAEFATENAAEQVSEQFAADLNAPAPIAQELRLGENEQQAPALSQDEDASRAEPRQVARTVAPPPAAPRAEPVEEAVAEESELDNLANAVAGVSADDIAASGARGFADAAGRAREDRAEIASSLRARQSEPARREAADRPVAPTASQEAPLSNACGEVGRLLQSGLIPVAVDCQKIEGFLKDTAAGVEVTWVTQTLENGDTLILAASTSDAVDPGLEAAVNSAIEERWSTRTAERIQARGAGDRQANTSTGLRGGYRVWLSARLDRDSLEALLQQIRVGN